MSLPQLFTAGVECGHTAARGGAQASDRHGLQAARAAARSLPRSAGARQRRPRATRGRAAGHAAAASIRRRSRCRKCRCRPGRCSYVSCSARRISGDASRQDAGARGAPRTSLESARDRIGELENSTIWRDDARRCAPRAIGPRSRGRGSRAALQACGGCRSCRPSRWSILRSKGPAALAQRVRAKVVPGGALQADRAGADRDRGRDRAARVRARRRAARDDRHPGLRQAAPDVQLPQEPARAHAARA